MKNFQTAIKKIEIQVSGWIAVGIIFFAIMGVSLMGAVLVNAFVYGAF